MVWVVGLYFFERRRHITTAGTSRCINLSEEAGVGMGRGYDIVSCLEGSAPLNYNYSDKNHTTS